MAPVPPLNPKLRLCRSRGRPGRFLFPPGFRRFDEPLGQRWHGFRVSGRCHNRILIHEALLPPVKTRFGWGAALARTRRRIHRGRNGIRRLHGWKTAPPSTNQERADDPAPAPTLLDGSLTFLACAVLEGSHAVHRTAPGAPDPPNVPLDTWPQVPAPAAPPGPATNPSRRCGLPSWRSRRLNRQRPGAIAPGFLGVGLFAGSMADPTRWDGPLTRSRGNALDVGAWRVEPMAIAPP